LLLSKQIMMHALFC